MIRRFNNLKIRTQSAIIILCTLVITYVFFELLWTYKWKFFEFATQMDFFYTQMDDQNFQDTLVEEALRYNIPESEEDTEAVRAIQPFLNLADEYTAIYIYGLEDGLYRAGKLPSIMENETFSTFFNLGYRLTAGEGEFFYEFPLQFANGIATVMVYNYKRVLYIYPYMVVCLILSVFLFLAIILIFLNRKMRQILILKDEILTMSTGDLTHTFPDYGGNEIGILAQELDHLRESLSDTIRKEQESHKANQDLITALSHDLRTPLTILTGYLEALKLKRNPQAQDIYLDRCLKKAKDIKELTDRMFEYALVSEEQETPNITWLSTDFIRQCLKENCDFIKLAGFTADIQLSDDSGVLQSDRSMLKRIFSNLFSNILKYGDKKMPVVTAGQMQETEYIIYITNTIKSENSHIDSNNIGLKNVDKMMRLLESRMYVHQIEEQFEVELRFPLQ